MSASPTDDIRIGEITTKWAKNNHIFVKYQAAMTSTNALAKEEAFTEPLFEEALALYLTDNQTQGRGRGNNQWVSSKRGSALYSSWSFLLPTTPQPTLAPLVGLAVYRALSTTWPFLPWNLKAPNDIYIGDKKTAGILIENVMQGDETRLIIGLGINILTHPSDVEIATSVTESLPPGVPLLGQDYAAFLDRLLFEITDAVSHCEEPLTPTDQYSLMLALNQHPLLQEPYIRIESDGTLVTATNTIHWSKI